MRMREVFLQKLLFEYLAEPTLQFKTLSGRTLQILTPGIINLFEGPDFIDMAIWVEGKIKIGNVEFHKKSSDWFKHKHTHNQNYQNLLLHIVTENDLPSDKIGEIDCFDTLIIPEEQILIGGASTKNQFHLTTAFEETNTEIRKTIIDLQEFAVLRLKRNAESIRQILRENDIEQTLKIVLENFISRYSKKRRRPIYSDDKLRNIISQVARSQSYYFLMQIEYYYNKFNSDKYYDENENNIIAALQQLVFKKNGEAGIALRKEIIVNCILPFAYAISNRSNQMQILNWYWSAPSLNQYGILRRKFANIPQDYVWIQQGMLEFLREYGG